MISRSMKVVHVLEPYRISAAGLSSVRNPYLNFLFSRIHLRFNPFGALKARGPNRWYTRLVPRYVALFFSMPESKGRINSVG